MGKDSQPKQKRVAGRSAKAAAAKLKNFWNNPPQGRYLNLKEILCFGGSAFGVSTLVTVVSGLITATQISGIYEIDVIHGPYICLIASILGLIIQPIFGKLLQNTQTKWGKYKPFILLMAPIFAAFAIAATWQPQGLTETSRTIYAYCVCIPTLIIWNLFQNTFYMMPGVITPNQQERTDIWSPIGLVIGFSPTVMNLLGNLIKGVFRDKGQLYLAYRYIGFIYAAVGLALVLCLFKVKERIIATAKNNEKVGFIEGFKMIFKNKPLLIFSLALILGSLRTLVEVDSEILGVLRYSSTSMANGQKIFGTLTLITGFAVTPNMILLPFMTRKFNNKTILIFWMTCNAVGYAVLGLIGIENIPQGATSAAVITILRYIALFNAIASLQPLMLSEMSDYQQLKTGKRLEGYIQMFAYTLVLVFTNIGYVVMAYVKQYMGFQPSEYYNDKITMVDDNLMKIATDYFDLALWISAISAALMAIAMIFYPLTKKQHAAIIEALKQKSLEEAGEASDENAEVVLDAENGQGEILVENENNEMVEEVINIDSKVAENTSESLIENDSLKSDDKDIK